MIGFGCSLIVHELAHSLVARAYGIELRSITLFIFGGAAQIENEPTTPRTEFLMAIAGPIASLALAAMFGAIHQTGAWADWPQPIVALARYLGLLNLVLGLFNLAPAFPLDGGRILRSALWARSGDLRAATQSAARAGAIFGAGLMGLGFLTLLLGAVSTGFWWLLMGLFIRSIAEGSITDLDIRRIAAGLPVAELVTPGSAPVDPAMTIIELIDRRMLRLHADAVPVVDGDRLLGLVSTTDIRSAPAGDRNATTVKDLARPCPPDAQVDVGATAAEALNLMRKMDLKHVIVRRAREVVGVVGLDDLLRSIALRLELEAPAAVPQTPASSGKATQLGA